MFANCPILRIVDLSKTDTSKVKNTNRMFKNCIAMVTPPEFDFSSVVQASEMYSGCNNILSLTFKNLSESDVSCENIVTGCNRLTTLGFTGKTHKDSARKIIDVLNNFILENKVSVSNLSRKIDETYIEIDNINDYQMMQDNEILTNMMASVDIFEMVVDMMSMQINTASDINNNYWMPKWARGGSKMVELYVTLILKGKKTINDVPVKIRPMVEAMLNDLGM